MQETKTVAREEREIKRSREGMNYEAEGGVDGGGGEDGRALGISGGSRGRH